MRADPWSSTLAVLRYLLLMILALSTGCSGDDHPGKTVYLKNCSQCHGKTGQGLKNLYPHLGNSPFFSERIRELPCLIVYGSSGTAKTGRTSSFMPPIPSVPPENMLLLIQFMQNRWSEAPSPITQTLIEQWLLSCAQQPQTR